MTDVMIDERRMVAGVRFHKIGRLYHFDYSAYPDLKVGDYVIVETARGRQMGQVMGFTAAEDEARDNRPILRLAAPRDLLLKQQWEAKQAEALETCKAKAGEIGGFEEVKFVAGHYNYDGTLLTILFTAEQKVTTSIRAELSRTFPAGGTAPGWPA
jgi:cell fate regulator YaaT (PSP1 superfamily)